VEDRSKDKYINKNKHDHIQTYIKMFVIVKYSMELWGGGKGKENGKESTISKYITSVQVEDIMICIESY
jgi:hypothetical protein